MIDKLFKKGLVIGIIVSFVCVSVLSSVLSKDASVSNDMVIDDNERGNWKTNFYCIINVEGDFQSNCEPNLGLFFVRNVEYYGALYRCKISGKNGTDFYNSWLELSAQYFFGYCISRNWMANMRGLAIKCKYRGG